MLVYSNCRLQKWTPQSGEHYAEAEAEEKVLCVDKFSLYSLNMSFI